jgi:cytosine/adenosine deaminase-related metal-dependent hydrolase
MEYLLQNGYVVIPEKASIKVEQADVYIREGRISYQAGETTPDRVIDCREKIIMPGLVNGHHHIYSMLSKGIPCKTPFGDFLGNLEKLWWNLDRALTEESVLLSTVLTLEDCLKQGVTTVFDHHISSSYVKGSLSRMAEIFDAYGVQGVLAFEISDRNGEKVMRSSLEENLDFARKQQGKPVQGMLGMHASFTLSEKSMALIAKKSGDIPIHIHVAEDKIDRRITLIDYDSLILERLMDYGLLRKNSLLIHCNTLRATELRKLEQVNAFVIQAVDSNMNNGLNTADINELEQRAIKTTVGTDGMSSNILKSFKNSFLVNKFIHQNSDIGFTEMNWLVQNSYELKRAYGYDLGIRSGEKADIAVIDYVPSTAFDENTFLAHWIYGITEARVQHVIKGDKILLDNYQVTEDPYADLKSRKLEISKTLFKHFKKLGD